MKKTMVRWVALLALCVGLLTVTAFAAAPTVNVSGVTLTCDGEPVYAITDSDGALTCEGADAGNYNIKFELENQVPTLTLRDATVNRIYSAWEETLVISGEGDETVLADGINVPYGSVVLNGSIQSVTNSDGAAIQTDGNVTINGTVEELAGRFGAIYTIGLYDEESSFVGGDVIIRGSVGALTGTGYAGSVVRAAGSIEICEIAQVGDVLCSDWDPEDGPQSGRGFEAEKDLVIDGAVGRITGKEHGLYAGENILIRGTVGMLPSKAAQAAACMPVAALNLRKTRRWAM